MDFSDYEDYCPECEGETYQKKINDLIENKSNKNIDDVMSKARSLIFAIKQDRHDLGIYINILQNFLNDCKRGSLRKNLNYLPYQPQQKLWEDDKSRY